MTAAPRAGVRSTSPGARGARLVAVAAWVLAVAVAAAVGWWAARATLERPAAAPVDTDPVLYTVAEGTVSRVLTFTASAQWQSVPVASNAATGIVTTVDVSPGDTVDVGSRLYSVGLRPVIAAVGAVPSFRDLTVGTIGADVEQLEGMLAAVGPFTGTVDTEFTATTATAVKAWQKTVGVAADGTVRAADVLFMPSLPARVTLSPELRVGAPAAPAAGAVDVLPAAPTFTVVLAADQASLVPLTAPVNVVHPDGTWTASTASSVINADNELVLTLAGADGAPVCAQTCDVVPIGDPAQYRAEIVVVPETTGPVVPSAALRTAPDGSVSVTTSDGASVPVQMLVASSGQAVVSGVEVGDTVELFGGTTP